VLLTNNEITLLIRHSRGFKKELFEEKFAANENGEQKSLNKNEGLIHLLKGDID